MLIGLMVFVGGISVYGKFIDSYDIETDDEYSNTYAQLEYFKNQTDNVVVVSEDIGKQVEGGNSTISGTAADITLWSAAISAMGIFWKALPISFDILHTTGGIIGIDPWYTNIFIIIIVIIVAFAVLSAVLRQKI